MNSKKLFASRVTTVVLVALATVLGIHIVAQNGESLRADLTADDLFSLSPGSFEILDRMQQEGAKPIDIKLYFSLTAGKSLPKFIKQFITYEKYLRTLLAEYEVASKGKVSFEVFDPVPDSDIAQDASDFGLDGKPINQHGDLFFFGLVFQTETGSRDVIDFLWPAQQETIEYEISKRIHSLLWPTRQRIGVLSSLSVVSEAANPYMAQILAAQGKDPGRSWIAMELLQESYEVRAIESDAEDISHDEFDLVVVVHPKDLGQRTLWALDEWIVTGGNTLVFIDPYSLDDRPPQNPQQPWAAYQYKPSSNLTELMNGWGIERVEDQVAADFDLAIRRAVSRQGGAERVLVDLQISEENKDQALGSASPIFQGLSNLRFFLAGQLKETEVEEESGLTRTVLITTTAKGSTVEMKPGFPGDSGLVFTDLNTPGKVSDHFVPGENPVALAYMVQGKFPSAFPQGADLPAATPAPPPGLPPGVQLPPPTGGETTHVEAVAEADRAEASVVIFADVDFISDQVAFQNTPFGPLAANDNHKVLLNTVDYLFGSESLMKVRSKKSIERPFTKFDEIEARADRQTQEREKELRAEIDGFQEELREKQRGQGAANAALFQKQVQDEVDLLNDRIKEANRELRDIRKGKRAALESEEARVRFATLGATPLMVLALGLFLLFRRRQRDAQARRNLS